MDRTNMSTRSSQFQENNSSRTAGGENTSEGDQRLANRWNVHPTGEDVQGASGSLPVQETEPNRQELPENNDQQRNADRSQFMDHSCGGEEVQSMYNHLFRLSLGDEHSDNIVGRLCNGTFIWNIKNFQQHRREAINGGVAALYSPAVYTNQHGYKFCMRMYPNGVGTGVGNHVALFVHMLEGEYDHRLPWPFTGAITLSILEQSNAQHRNDVTKTVTTSPDLLAFQMPSATCCHIGCGFEKFAPIAQVCGPQYIKHDTMLIKIEIFQ